MYSRLFYTRSSSLMLTLLLVLIVMIALPLGIEAQNDSMGDRMNDSTSTSTLLTQKKLTAIRTATPPKIDGFLNDSVWAKSEIATNFTQLEPNPLEPSAYKTEVRFLYDDKAIYISFMCFDASGDVVLRQLSERDDIGNTDWVGVYINPYQDGLNGVGFAVTAAGVQQDAQFSATSEDISWNAVWWSEAQILENGWSAELRIPYAALRFPDAQEQQWNINFLRSVRRSREESWWDDIDPKIDGYFNQFGEVSGIKNIKPPTRLFLYPYISFNAEHFPSGDADASNWSQGFNAGLDLKYGINDAFTLDMTLIPDFGQVRSDNQVLNLSPFEVAFAENRQFFTEGTDLFNKGGLFYSRRIGARPGRFGEVDDLKDSTEHIINNPSVTQLINSTKVSGRMANGLGIGVFNSVTNEMFATLEDEAGNQRQIQTEPLTNYNIIVFDQNLNNNSFATLINTNVQRFGTADDANVTGAIFRLNNKTNEYSTSGRFIYSYQTDENGDVANGFQSSLSLGKISGNFQFGVANTIRSQEYDYNDLGLMYQNNLINNSVSATYQIFKPFGAFNRARININSYSSHRYEDRAFQNFGFRLNYFMLAKTFFAFGLNSRLVPIPTYDYFEPRVDGRYLTNPTNWNVNGWISSDYRKVVAIDANVDYSHFNQEGRRSYGFRVSPRFRVNDKLFVTAASSLNWRANDIGYVNILDEAEDSIIMGRRMLRTVENSMFAQYIFSNKAGLTFRMRHYWRVADYNRYFLLGQDGALQPSDYDGLDENLESDHNISFNAFNIDCIFNWQFAPGSFMTVVWKNSIFRDTKLVNEQFTENVSNTFDADQTNSFSIRIIYFLDYLTIKNALR